MEEISVSKQQSITQTSIKALQQPPTPQMSQSTTKLNQTKATKSEPSPENLKQSNVQLTSKVTPIPKASVNFPSNGSIAPLPNLPIAQSPTTNAQSRKMEIDSRKGNPLVTLKSEPTASSNQPTPTTTPSNLIQKTTLNAQTSSNETKSTKRKQPDPDTSTNKKKKRSAEQTTPTASNNNIQQRYTNSAAKSGLLAPPGSSTLGPKDSNNESDQNPPDHVEFDIPTFVVSFLLLEFQSRKMT